MFSKSQSQLHLSHTGSRPLPKPRNSDSVGLNRHKYLCCVSFHGNSIVRPCVDPQSSRSPSSATVIGFLLVPHSWCYSFKCLHNHLQSREEVQWTFKNHGLIWETCDPDDNALQLCALPGHHGWPFGLLLCILWNANVLKVLHCLLFFLLTLPVSKTCL